MSGNGNESTALGNLQDYLDEITNSMSRVRRWGGRYGSFETVTEHTVQQAQLCLIMHVMECAHGNADGIDRGRLLACAILHDQGEGLLGDVLWSAKQHPKLKQPLAEVEREFFHRAIIAPLPAAVGEVFQQQYDTQEDLAGRTGRFFRASEVVGYLLRAIQQYRLGKLTLGQHTFVRQYAAMCEWAEEFASVRIIFSAFREEVEQSLANDPECIALAQKEGRAERIRELLAARGNGQDRSTASPSVVGT